MEQELMETLDVQNMIGTEDETNDVSEKDKPAVNSETSGKEKKEFKPDEKSAYERVKSEKNNIQKELDAQRERQLNLEAELTILRNRMSQPAQREPEKPMSSLPDDQFVEGRAVNEVVGGLAQRLRQIEQNLQLSQEQQAKQIVAQINESGRKRFGDFNAVAGALNRYLKIQPDSGVALWNSIVNAPDPAEFAYLLGGGRMQPKTAGDQPPKTANNRILNDEEQVKTFAETPASGSAKSYGLSFEQYVNLSEKDKRKIKDKYGDKFDDFVTNLRKDYYKRNNIQGA